MWAVRLVPMNHALVVCVLHVGLVNINLRMDTLVQLVTIAPLVNILLILDLALVLTAVLIPTLLMMEHRVARIAQMVKRPLLDLLLV